MMIFIQRGNIGSLILKSVLLACVLLPASSAFGMDKKSKRFTDVLMQTNNGNSI